MKFPGREFIMDIKKSGLTEECIKRHKNNFHLFCILIDPAGKYIELTDTFTHYFLDFEQDENIEDGYFKTSESFTAVKLLFKYKELFHYFDCLSGLHLLQGFEKGEE